jgi:hypothetical protein
VARNVAVVTLVDAEEAQEMGWDFGCCSRAFARPEECVDVVGSVEHCALANVEAVSCCFELEQASRQFEV